MTYLHSILRFGTGNIPIIQEKHPIKLPISFFLFNGIDKKRKKKPEVKREQSLFFHLIIFDFERPHFSMYIKSRDFAFSNYAGNDDRDH